MCCYDHYFHLFLKKIFQCCTGFCHTKVLISHNYIYISCLLNLPPLSHPIPPAHRRAPGCAGRQAGLRLLHGNFYQLSILQNMLMLLSPFVPLLPCPSGSTGPFSTSVSPVLPCKNLPYDPATPLLGIYPERTMIVPQCS